MNRRSFMQAILATGMAPAVVGSGILMPVRTIWRPDYSVGSIESFSFNREWIDITISVEEYVKRWKKDADIYAGIRSGATGNRIAEALAGGRPLPWKDVLAHGGRQKE